MADEQSTSNQSRQFDPKSYWESRLGQKFSLAGVGDIRMPLSYNQVLYALRGNAFKKALRFVGKSAQVLDVGSGSGFYIDQWKQTGASVTGSDLTNTAVANLAEKYPECSFVEWDAGSVGLPGDKRFDAISAFDVFFHIVDDARYSQAIANVSSLLKPGGHFLYSDYFMRGEEKRMEHIAFRSRQRIDQVMTKNGLREVARIPVFWMMNSPVVTDSRIPRKAFNVLLRLAGRSELFGTLFGWAAYPVERLMLAMTRRATGTELVVYKKS
jgi:2-polyprenyl-3-methyl-5-hydroxy-6-metoxy-1,4-benzoquinol methylase